MDNPDRDGRGDPIDLLVVGGGVNGAGIARDAAGRGLRVMLVEQGDLAGATSSASTKLIHGGLRYLEHRAFRLVREALRERETLLRIAPHIAWPMRFVLPHAPDQRPAWLIRLGLFLYDHLGHSSLPRSYRIDLRRDPAGAVLRPRFATGFAYSDCWVDDSRLVVLNAIDARERGAIIRVRTRCLGAERVGKAWRARLADASGETVVTARALVNAAGPWIGALRTGSAGSSPSLAGSGPARARLVKGSHIVVPRIGATEEAYLFQNDDRRVIFAIPYETDFTLIGTTDVEMDGDPSRPAITPAETAYLCRAASRYLRAPVTPASVAHSFAGVRTLRDDESADPSAVTRDYTLALDAPPGEAPLLTVIGGKITTYRRLAEHALARLAPLLGTPRPSAWTTAWTGTAPLPGGDFADFDAFLEALRAAYPFLPAPTARRLARAYGTRAERFLRGARRLSDLGEDLGAGMTEAEAAYLASEEWALSAEDALWRRSKRGLHMTQAERERFARLWERAVAPVG